MIRALLPFSLPHTNRLAFFSFLKVHYQITIKRQRKTIHENNDKDDLP